MTRPMRDRLKGSTTHQDRCCPVPRDCFYLQRAARLCWRKTPEGQVRIILFVALGRSWARARPLGQPGDWEAQRTSLSARAPGRESVTPAPAPSARSPAETPCSSPGRRRPDITPLPCDPGSALGAAAPAITSLQAAADSFHSGSRTTTRTWVPARAANDSRPPATSSVAGPPPVGRARACRNVVHGRPEAPRLVKLRACAPESRGPVCGHGALAWCSKSSPRHGPR